MTSLRIAFAGTPQFALPALRALLQSDAPRGRRADAAGSPGGPRPAAARVAGQTTRAGRAICRSRSRRRLKTPESRKRSSQWAPDVLVVVAYGLILPPPVLALPRLGCVNIHGSLLPRWRGAAPIQRAILAGDAETGVTIMQLDAGLDTGPMLLERRRPIGSHDTAGDLHDALSELGAAALIEALDGLAAGTLKAACTTVRRRDLRPEDRKIRSAARLVEERDPRSTPRCAPSIPGRSPKPAWRVRRCACCRRASRPPRARKPRPAPC